MTTDTQDQTDPNKADLNRVIDIDSSDPASLTGAEERIAELESELAAEKDLLLRTRAEFENSRRLALRDREEGKEIQYL